MHKILICKQRQIFRIKQIFRQKLSREVSLHFISKTERQISRVNQITNQGTNSSSKKIALVHLKLSRTLIV